MREQDQPGGLSFSRVGGDRIGHVLPAGAELEMPEIGISVPVAEFYDGLSFADATATS
jgi:hypothetical protein